MLCIHVGPHKTGTSYIQRNLKQNRKEIEARGWTYPKIGYDGSSHSKLSLNPEKAVSMTSHFYKRLKELGEKSDKIIFSGENFSGWSIEHFKKLAAILGRKDNEVHVLFILRDPVDILYSFWSEEVKHGYTFSLPERYTQLFSSADNHFITNPTKFLDPIKNNTEFNLHLFDYGQIRRDDLDLFEQIMTVLPGLESLRAKSKGRVNTRYDIRLTEFMRLLGKQHAHDQHLDQSIIGHTLRDVFTDHLKPEEKTELIQTIQSLIPSPMRSLQVGRDNAHYKALEQKLLAEYSSYIHPKAESRLFSHDRASLIYCDEFTLLTHPKTKMLLDFHYDRIKPYIKNTSITGE